MPAFLRIAGGPSAGYIAIAVPWGAALVIALYRRHVRIIGFVAALISAIACALPLGAASAGQSLYQALMLLFCCLTLGAALILPRRDCTAGSIGGILFILDPAGLRRRQSSGITL